MDSLIKRLIDFSTGLLQCGLEDLLSSLSSFGIINPVSTHFIPSKIRILAEGIQSQKLLDEARVKDDDDDHLTTLGFDVASSINLFRNPTHAGLTWPFPNGGGSDVKGENVVEKKDADINVKNALQSETPVTQNAKICHNISKRLTDPQAVKEFETMELCLNSSLTNSSRLKVINEGDLHAFIHWFQLVNENENEVILDTGVGCTAFEGAAFLVDDKPKVFRDQHIGVEMTLRNGRILFSVTSN